jgi:hypothetical protein
VSAPHPLLKKAVRAAIDRAGHIKGAVDATEKSNATVGRWHARNEPDLPNLGDALALDEVAVIKGERAEILHRYAAELGHVAIRLPEPGQGGDALTSALIEASAEFGDVAAELRDATRDGTVNPRERERIVEQIDEAMTSLARMRALAADDSLAGLPPDGCLRPVAIPIRARER